MGEVRSIEIYKELRAADPKVVERLSQQDRSIISVALNNLIKPKQQENISEPEFRYVFEKLKATPQKIGFFQKTFNAIANFFHTKLSPSAIIKQQEIVKKYIDSEYADFHSIVDNVRDLRTTLESLHLEKQNIENYSTWYSDLKNILVRDPEKKGTALDQLNKQKALNQLKGKLLENPLQTSEKETILVLIQLAKGKDSDISKEIEEAITENQDNHQSIAAKIQTIEQKLATQMQQEEQMRDQISQK